MPRNYRGFRQQLAAAVTWFGNSRGIDDSDAPPCPRCGAIMTFYGGDLPLGEGHWDCPECGFGVTEEELEPYKDRANDEPWRYL